MRPVVSFTLSFFIASVLSGGATIFRLRSNTARFDNEIRLAARWAASLHVQNASSNMGIAIEEYARLLNTTQPSEMNDLLSLQLEGYATAVRTGDSTMARTLYAGAQSSCKLAHRIDCEKMLRDVERACEKGQLDE